MRVRGWVVGLIASVILGIGSLILFIWLLRHGLNDGSRFSRRAIVMFVWLPVFALILGVMCIAKRNGPPPG